MNNKMHGVDNSNEVFHFEWKQSDIEKVQRKLRSKDGIETFIKEQDAIFEQGRVIREMSIVSTEKLQLPFTYLTE